MKRVRKKWPLAVLISFLVVGVSIFVLDQAGVLQSSNWSGNWASNLLGKQSDNPDRFIKPTVWYDSVLPKLESLWRFESVPQLQSFLNYSCPEIPNWQKLSKQDLACLPALMKCYFNFLQNESEDSNREVVPAWLATDEAPIQIHKVEQNLNDVLFYVQAVGKDYQVFRLPNTCHETELPQGEYMSGARWFQQYKTLWKDDYQESPDLREIESFLKWKHDQGSLWVDTRLVRNWEIAGRKTESSDSKWFEPATDLTANQMNQHCRSLGKEVLQAHIYDAAAFYRDDNPDTRSQKSFYPWSSRIFHDWLVPFSRLIPSKEEEVSEETFNVLKEQFCPSAWSQECGAFKGSEWKSGLSWIGLRELIGGPLEYVQNLKDPRFNLLMTSSYFDRFSHWHILGHRVHWDEKGHGPESIDPISNLLGYRLNTTWQGYEKLRIGFRCMRKRERSQ